MNFIKFYKDGVLQELNGVDKAICEHLGVPFNEKKWCALTTTLKEREQFWSVGLDWYNVIAKGLALGFNYYGIMTEIAPNSEVVHKICDFLKQNYTYESGWCVK